MSLASFTYRFKFKQSVILALFLGLFALSAPTGFAKAHLDVAVVGGNSFSMLSNTAPISISEANGQFIKSWFLDSGSHQNDSKTDSFLSLFSIGAEEVSSEYEEEIFKSLATQLSNYVAMYSILGHCSYCPPLTKDLYLTFLATIVLLH